MLIDILFLLIPAVLISEILFGTCLPPSSSIPKQHCGSKSSVRLVFESDKHFSWFFGKFNLGNDLCHAISAANGSVLKRKSRLRSFGTIFERDLVFSGRFNIKFDMNHSGVMTPCRWINYFDRMPDGKRRIKGNYHVIPLIVTN